MVHDSMGLPDGPDDVDMDMDQIDDMPYANELDAFACDRPKNEQNFMLDEVIATEEDILFGNDKASHPHATESNILFGDHQAMPDPGQRHTSPARQLGNMWGSLSARDKNNSPNYGDQFVTYSAVKTPYQKVLNFEEHQDNQDQ